MTSSFVARDFWRFQDRHEAGEALAAKLAPYRGRPDVIVLALPRGGVPVAAAIADALHAPLDVFLVRKLGVPGHEEFAFGALASGGQVVLNRDIVESLGLTSRAIQHVEAAEYEELVRRERAYRDDLPLPDLRGKTVIVVDDGLATGSTMYAAVSALHELAPARIVVAAPVASAEAIDTLRSLADDVVFLLAPDPFGAVGLWYRRFEQVSDDEVRTLLTGRMLV
jgi:predicted phosphoribosyltransferase